MLKDIRNSALGAFAVLALAAHAPAQSCAGDLDGSGEVGGADLGTLLNAWGSCSSCAADLNGDGAVNGADLGTLLANWDACQIITPSWATLVEARPDPAVVTDPVLRAAIEATGLAWRVRDTGTQVEMLLVPPGTFQMGCSLGSTAFGCYESELPVHSVSIGSPFYLGRYELTQAQWTQTLGFNPSEFQGLPDSHARPVERTSWLAAQAFLGITGFRLPSEAEWEFACRAGTLTPFYNGSVDDGSVGDLAWYGGCCGTGNSGGATRPVGTRAANALGLFDMLGNVHEWVNDWYGPYPADAQRDPQGPSSGSTRLMRGGSWLSETNDVRSSHRCHYPPEFAIISVGFRVARDP